MRRIRKNCLIITFAVFILSLLSAFVFASTTAEESADALRKTLHEQCSSYINEAANSGEYELTKYFGSYLEDVMKDFPDLTEDGFNMYYTVYKSESTGTVFSVINADAQEYDHQIIGVCAVGDDCRYLIHGLSSTWDEPKLTDYIEEKQWAERDPELGNYITSDGDLIEWWKTGNDSGPLYLVCLWNPHVYKASPSIVTEPKDLAGYIGKPMREAIEAFPELAIEQNEGSVLGILNGAKLRAEGDVEDPEEARIVEADLDMETPSDYCIYGVNIDTDPEKKEEILNSIGLFNDGGSGEYFDAEGNVFYSYEPAIYSSEIFR